MRPPLRYTYTPAGHFGQLGAVRALTEEGATAGAITFHGPEAWVDVDEEAGTMISTALPRISNAAVLPQYRRMGVGSELHRIASREMGPNFVLAHSGSLSPAGHAFAKATGGDIPRSARSAPTAAERGERYTSVVMSDAQEIAEEGAFSGKTRSVEGSPASPLKGRRPRRRKPEQLVLGLDL